MSTTLPLFWNLSSASKKERIDSSVKLVSALEQFQAQFSYTSENSEPDDDEDAVDPLDKYNAQDVSYSIRRLIRGLASPRESSRLGFSVALTELLSRITTITCSQVFALIISSTKITKSISGQEERDILFARLFGITAIIQSGLLVRTDPLSQSPSSSTGASSLSAFQEVVSELISVGGKKSWLRESVWWSLILALEALHKSNAAWKNDGLQYALEAVYEADPQWSPEKVAITLKLQEMLSDKDWPKLTAPVFSNPNLLSTSNLHALALILKETEDSEGAKTAGGSWKPELHFVWTTILEQLLPLEGSPKGNFSEFFRIVVDESLFNATSTPQRKYWGFQIFQKALPRLSEDVLPMIFTKNFMRTWINHLSKQDRYLHKAAKQTASDVSAFVKERPQLGMGLIVQLTGANGTPQFDKLTHTKTVENILASMSAEGILNYVDHLIKQFNECDGIDRNDVEALNARRLWIVEQLGALVKNGSLLKDDIWIQGILEWLTVNGLFMVRKPAKHNKGRRGTDTVVTPPLSDALRASCRARLLSCLSDLASQTTIVKNDEKLTRAQGAASDGEFWICRALTIIETFQKDTKHLSPLVELESEEQAVHEQVRTLVDQLGQTPSDADQKEAAQGCRLLVSGLLISEYCSEGEGWDTETLESCIGHAQSFAPKKKSKKSKKAEVSTEDSPPPIDSLVDIIIGLLEKSSGYLRTLGNNSFSLLSGAVTETSIDLILAQLERRDPTQDESDEEGDDEEDGAEAASGEEASEGEDSENSDDDVDVDEDDDGEMDEEVQKKILDALKMNGIEAATGESEEEETMDDDQMMALDDQLAAALRSTMQERKSGKDVDAQREATYFKNRVLDLVDLFVKNQPTSPFVINTILPLVTLISSSGSDEKQLIDKAQGVLRSRIGKSKEVPTTAPLDKVSEVIEALHARARKARSDLSSTLCALCVYLSKIMVHQHAEDKVTTLYQASLEDFFTRKNSALTPTFFQDFFTKFSGLAWRMRQPILDLSCKAVNAYRKLQGLRLIQSMLNNLHSVTEKKDEDVVVFMTSLRKSLYEIVSEACGDQPSLNASQVKDVLKLALSALRQTARLPSADIDAIWGPKKWQKLSEKLTTSANLKSSPALPALCQQMVQVATGKAEGKAKGVKRKGDASVEEKEGKRQKKRPKT